MKQKIFKMGKVYNVVTNTLIDFFEVKKHLAVYDSDVASNMPLIFPRVRVRVICYTTFASRHSTLNLILTTVLNQSLPLLSCFFFTLVCSIVICFSLVKMYQ